MGVAEYERNSEDLTKFQQSTTPYSTNISTVAIEAKENQKSRDFEITAIQMDPSCSFELLETVADSLSLWRIQALD